VRATRWQQIEELFETARPLAGQLRQDLLARACGDDDDLRAEVQAMLAAQTSGRELHIERLAPRGPADHHAPSDPMLAKHLGPWRVARVLGRGGMGTVYLVDRADGQYRQQAALKLLSVDHRGHEAIERFRTERQVLARLAHPNISRLLDGGFAPDGRPYLVMELVEGAPIIEWCRARDLSLPERLRLFVVVCEAVEQAHGAQIVHRDIKPANILVSSAGQVKLLDFGIAKLLEPARLGLDPPATRAEQLLLTPEYAAPEQLSGDAITTATDVYALGVVLYELLTGMRPPAPSAGTRAPAAHGRWTPIRSPGERMRRRGDDLDCIVRTALREQSARRYVSAGQLGADLGRFLQGRPVLARPDTFRYRASRFVARHRRAFALAAAAIVSITVLGALAERQTERAQAARDRALLERDRTEAMTHSLRGSARRDHALSLVERGQHRQAAEELLESHHWHVRELGEHHPRTSYVAGHIAELRLVQRRYAEALSWFDRALAFHQRWPLERNPRSYRLRGQRASTLLRLGRGDEAVSELRAAEADLLAMNAPDGPGGSLTAVRIWLARALTETGHPAEAEAPARRAMAAIDLVGAHGPRRPEATCELARALILSGRRSAGQQLLSECLPAYRRFPRADVVVVQALEELARMQDSTR
jgi:tetratricopeptide (TPR) repeat protein